MKEIKLANGEILPIGVNFLALKLMSKFPGGMIKLQKDTEKARMYVLDGAEAEATDANQGEDELAIGMEAMSYMLWAMVRAGGKICTQEECDVMIGFEDMPKIYEAFEEFTKGIEKLNPTIVKNAMSRGR